MKKMVNELDNIIANLTKGEKKVYDFLVKYQQKNLFLPTMIEIGEGTGIKSTSGVSLYLDRLEAHGLIKFYKKKASRAITLNYYKLVRCDEVN